MLFFCCSPSASRFSVLCVQRCSSDYLDYKKWLLLLPCLLVHLKLSDYSPLTSGVNKAFSLPLTRSVCFQILSVSFRDGCERKKISQYIIWDISEIFRPTHLAATTTPRSKSVKSPLLAIMLSLNYSRSSCLHAHTDYK